MGRPRKFQIPLNRKINIKCQMCGQEVYGVPYRSTIDEEGNSIPYMCNECKGPVTWGVVRKTGPVKKFFEAHDLHVREKVKLVRKVMVEVRLPCKTCSKYFWVLDRWVVKNMTPSLWVCPPCRDGKERGRGSEIVHFVCPSCGHKKVQVRSGVKACERCENCRRHFFPDVKLGRGNEDGSDSST